MTGWSANNQGNRGAGSSQAYKASRTPMYQQGNQSPRYHDQGWNNQQNNQGWSAKNQGNWGGGSSQAYNASRAPMYQQGNQSPPYHNQGWNNQQNIQGWSANNQGNRRASSSQAYNASRASTYQQGNQYPPHHNQGWNNQQNNQGWSANNQLDNFLEDPPISSYCLHAFLNFDGSSKGNPGPAGAGAVLRAADGSMVYRLREGLGVATNNFAEYRGLILGLEYALKQGFKHIQVQGDSKLVCMQTQGIWQARNQYMVELSETVKELKDQFTCFLISHVDRQLNNEADAQANLAVYLENGETQVDVE